MFARHQKESSKKSSKKTSRNATILVVVLIVFNIYAQVSHLQVLDIQHSVDSVDTLSNHYILSEQRGADVQIQVEKTVTSSKHKSQDDAPAVGESCEFLSENEGPIPVILFARGRTGSSITWNVMSRLTGHGHFAEEKVRDINLFVEEIVNNTETDHNWALSSLCEVQHKQFMESGHSTATGIAGFQWKPIRNSLNCEYGKEGLRRVAEQRNPTVRAVILTRNFLDMKYSNLKHRISKAQQKIPPHCSADDEECVKIHLHLQQKRPILFRPTGRKLMRDLHFYSDTNRMLIQMLDALSIEYVEVTYEKLYDSDSAEEWMRIFKYLGRGPSVNLTMEEVSNAMGLKRTNQKRNKDEIISNIADVRKTLKGTKYEDLLDSTWI